jgi:hypothetical protein
MYYLNTEYTTDEWQFAEVIAPFLHNADTRNLIQETEIKYVRNITQT